MTNPPPYPPTRKLIVMLFLLIYPQLHIFWPHHNNMIIKDNIKDSIKDNTKDNFKHIFTKIFKSQNLQSIFCIGRTNCFTWLPTIFSDN